MWLILRVGVVQMKMETPIINLKSMWKEVEYIPINRDDEMNKISTKQSQIPCDRYQK
jgi:hypothetical protein